MTRKQPKRHDRPGVDRYGRTELHYAASEGDVARVRELLVSGADPAAPDDDGWTPLHFAAQAHAAQICEALLTAGAPVDATDRYGNTPLLRATFESRGRGDVITVLRRHGADPARLNAHGISPVALARTIANYEVAKYYSDVAT